MNPNWHSGSKKVYDWLNRAFDFIVGQCFDICSAVARHFKPSPGCVGWRGLLSRFANLWRSGWRGKFALLLLAVVIRQAALGLGGDGKYLVPQSGNHPRRWYEKCEEEPYGLIGYKGIRPVGKTPAGVPIYSDLPALSEVKSAFVYDMCWPIATSARYEFPKASNRKGRLMACKQLQQSIAMRESMMNSIRCQRNMDAIMDGVNSRAREADRSAAISLAEIDRKKSELNREVQDFNAARANQMTTSQYETYKQNPGYEQISPPSMYSTGPAGNPDLFRSPDGSIYEIDSQGDKRLIWW